jgi:hypothetical protein
MSDPAQDEEPTSYIVRYLSKALSAIEKVEIVNLLLRWLKGLQQPTHGRGIVLIDQIVIALMFAAIASYVFSFILNLPYAWMNWTIGVVVVLFSAWRIFTLACFHLNLVVATSLPVVSYERSFLLMIANYIEVTFWYATWYSIAIRNDLFEKTAPMLPLSILRESIAMMVVNTSGLFEPKSSCLLWVAMCTQSVVGLFLTIVVFARTMNALPAPGVIIGKPDDKNRS